MMDNISNKPQDEQMAYDLGWLLHNQQVSDERLCSYLLSETSVEIERFLIYFLKSPTDRMAALDQIILTVLLGRHLYKNNISGKAWLYQLIIQECMARLPQGQSIRRKGIHPVIQTLDTHFVGEGHFNPFLNSLTQQQRLLAVLHYGHHLSAGEIVVVLKMGLEPVQTGLEQIRQGLMAHQRSCGECSSLHSTLKGMETALREALQPDDDRVETARGDPSQRTGLLLSRLAQKKNSQRTRKWVSRVFEAGLVLLLLIFGEWAFTRSGAIQSIFSEPTDNAIVRVADELPIPQPVPTLTPVPEAAIIAQDEDSEKVLSMALAGPARLRSFWADVQVKTFKVENYTDGSGSLPGVALRKQIWFNLQGYARVISGPLLGSPDSTYSIYRGRFSGQDFNSGQVIESAVSELISDTDLQKLFLPNDSLTLGGRFTQMGSEMVAGRPAWVLDWGTSGRRTYRYWIDQGYGVVLRRLEYGNSLFQPVVSDLMVTKIYFDTSFSAAIYEPGRYKGDHFAIDFSGNPEIPDLKSGLQAWSNPMGQVPVAGTTPPYRYSLADSNRSFFNGPTSWMKDAGTPHLVLYADPFDISQLPLGGKSILACERSPDGVQIAFNSPPQQNSGDTALMVADLSTTQSPGRALPDGITSGDFAFSPDGRRLAFFGCEKSSGFCGIFILDIASGKITRTLPLAYADYITWSPDGRSIALVGNDDSSGHGVKLASANLLLSELMALLHTWHFQVMDADSGSLTYKKQFDWFNLSAPPDSPTQRWDRPFKVTTFGVKGCDLPPGG